VEKKLGADRAKNTFEFIAAEWLTVWSRGKAKTTIDHTQSRLRNDILPVLGKKPITSITTLDVLTALRRIENRGAIETVHKSKNIISQVMRYAVSTERADQNPILNIYSSALQSRKPKHMASITEPARVAELLRAIESYKGTYQVQAALRLAPLVFVRIGELRSAEWADIDLARAEWKFVVSKTKTEHLVPLAVQAVEILTEIHMLTGEGKYVFPGIRYGRPISDMTINRALQSMGYDTKEEMTGHGFRAMARTLLAEELGFQPEVIEHQLAHKVPDRLGAAYNRTKYLADRKRMMQAWADYLDGLKAKK
jgi:integrase